MRGGATGSHISLRNYYVTREGADAQWLERCSAYGLKILANIIWRTIASHRADHMHATVSTHAVSLPE
jgi:hypothetical protein